MVEAGAGGGRGTAWPLVGRDADLDVVHAALERGGAVVVGAAGVGKSRLALEAAGRADAAAGVDGAPVRVAGRLSAREVPLSPFASIVPSASGVLAPLDAPAVLADALAGRWGGDGAPVLFVDDAQWLDPVSVTVLHQLAVDHRVRLLVTVRQGEPVAPEIVQLHTDELLARIELAPLAPDAVHELLLTVLDGPVEEATVANLARVCAGNVLYLRELVLGSIEADLLVRQHGVWRFTGSLTATPRLREIVDARLAFLDDAAREVLEVVAVAGVLDLGVLLELVEDRVVEALERIGLLATSTSGGTVEVELGHPLHGEVLRDRTPQVARRRIARSLALAGEARVPWADARPDQRMQRALWHLDGGLAIDASRLLAAARESVDAGDKALAGRLAAAAFAIDGSAPAVILASWCHAELGERDEAERLLLEAMDPAGVPLDQAAITILYAEDLYWGRGDPDTPERLLDDLLAGPLGADPAAAELIGAHRPVFTVLSGRVADGLAEVAPYVGTSSPLASLQAEVPHNLGEILAGRCTDAVARAAATLERAMVEDHPYLVNPGPHIVAMGWGMLHDADVAGARAIAELIYAEAARRPGHTDRGWAASVLGIVHLEAGHLHDAVRCFVEAEAMWRRGGVEAFARIAVGLRVLAGAQCGVREAVGDLGVLDHEPATMQFMEVYVVRGRAWADWAAGRRDAAVAGLGQAVALGRAQGARVLAAGAAHDLTRIGRADLAVEAFDALGPFPEAATARHYAALAAAVHATDLDSLVAVAEALAAGGLEIAAAEAEMTGARWAKRRGRTRDADRLAAQAAVRATGLGDVRTPMLDGARRAGPLSRREREVAELAAAGLSNRQIADALVLSERTVENHLYRVFTKLGITGRDEIAAVLGD